MALWDKLKTELDRAGKAAQTAIGDGKVRIDLMRVRQLADKTAEALGYAVFNARQKGEEMDADSYSRLSATLAAHMAEVERLEAQLAREEANEAGESGAGDSEAPAHNAPHDVPHGGPAMAQKSADAVSAEATGSAPETITSVDPAMGDNPDRATPDAP